MKRGSSLRRTEWPKPWITGAAGASGMGVTQLLRTHRGLAAQLRRPVLNGFDDVDVARAAAQIARNTPPDFLLGRARLRLQHCFGGHDHARCAEATLQAMLLPEAVLKRVKRAVLLQTFDGFDLTAIRLDREQGARLDVLTVENDRARPAVRGVAANMRARQVQVLSDEVDQQQARFDLGGVLLAVYPQRD